MSALVAPWAKVSTRLAKVPRLQQVRIPHTRMGGLPFLAVVATVLALGMVGLLALNTALQNQAFVVRDRQRTATELSYQVAALESQVNVKRSPAEVARRASELGMRANPFAVYVVLPEGRILGTPTKVTGGELPSMVFKSEAQLKAEADAKLAAEELAAAQAELAAAAQNAAQAQAAAQAAAMAATGEAR